MKRETPSMFRNVPESEKPVGVSIGDLANRVVGKIDAGRKELSEAADRNRALILRNDELLTGGNKMVNLNNATEVSDFLAALTKEAEGAKIIVIDTLESTINGPRGHSMFRAWADIIVDVRGGDLKIIKSKQ